MSAERIHAAVLQSILDSMGDGVVVVDARGDLMSANPAALQILGADPLASLASLCLPDQISPCPPGDTPLARAIAGAATDAAELFLPPGRWLSITARPQFDGDGAICGGVAVIRDMSAARSAEMALRQSEERYALAARGANDGLWDWDLQAGRLFLSPRWKTMLGLDEGEIGDAPAEWLDRIHPDDLELFKVRLSAHFRRLISFFEHEYRIRHASGAYRWVLCRGLAVWGDSGQATRIAGSQTDITVRRAVEQQLQHDALHDLLTGLPNRALFIDRLDRAIAIARREKTRLFAVLFLDIDRFKTINDSLGHATGDELLTIIAQRIQKCLRPGDTVARLGGDEFTILVEQIADMHAVEVIAGRIQRTIADAIMLGDHQAITTVSIGITTSALEYASSSEMIRDADTAMYHAKMGGKDRYVLFTPVMHAQAMAKLQLESDLREALARGELRLHYQPIIALAGGRVSGFEALLRWQHPQGGLLYPGAFLDIAEETGLIVPISWWVLREACCEARMWQDEFALQPTLAVNVNLSARLFAEPDIVGRIAAVLESSGLPPSSLKLELTEHNFVELNGETSATLRRIRDLGVQLCIDDFGTGYSSLSYLYSFPVNTLKIDRSFIRRLGLPDGQSEIVQTIIGLAHTLGMDVVAEGIETEQQYAQLRELQCGLGQGWLFAPGLDSQDVRKLLAETCSRA